MIIKGANRWSPIVVCILCVAALFASSCSKRKTVSDSELAVIFRDAFLANAYTSKYNLNLDSLRLYEPIFQKYGYTTDDVQYSIGSFATRKSARLGDVVERAITMLETEGLALDKEVAILDTIDNIAQRRAMQTIYSDPLIEMRSWSDTSQLYLLFEEIETGNYTVNFDYRIDSLNETGGFKFISWMEVESNFDTMLHMPKYLKKGRSFLNLSKSGVAHVSRSINVEEGQNRLVIRLAEADKMDADKRPSLVIKNLVIKRKLPFDESREVIFDQLVPIKVFNDEFYATTPKDSL